MEYPRFRLSMALLHMQAEPGSSNTGAIVGAAVGSSVGGLALLGCGYFAWQHYSKSSGEVGTARAPLGSCRVHCIAGLARAHLQQSRPAQRGF